MLPVHLHSDRLGYQPKFPRVKEEKQKEESPVFFMSSIPSCRNALCDLSQIADASFQNTYHIGETRMEAINRAEERSRSSDNIEEEEFAYYHKPVSRRTFISTSYTAGRPLARTFAGSNKRRKISEEQPHRPESDPNRFGEDISESFAPAIDSTTVTDSNGRYKESLFDDNIPEFEEKAKMMQRCENVRRGLVETSVLIESFVNPALAESLPPSPQDYALSHDLGEGEEKGEEGVEIDGVIANSDAAAAIHLDNGEEAERERTDSSESGRSEEEACSEGELNKSDSFLGGLEWF